MQPCTIHEGTRVFRALKPKSESTVTWNTHAFGVTSWLILPKRIDVGEVDKDLQSTKPDNDST